MNEKGIGLTGPVDGDTTAIDSLADIAEQIKIDSTELVIIARHLELMNDALRLIMEQVTDMNTRFGNIAQQVKDIAEAEQEAVETANDAAPNTPIPRVPAGPAWVHGKRYTDGLAICGALGTAAQPFAGCKNERVSSVYAEITCPKCLRIIDGKQAVQEKS